MDQLASSLPPNKMNITKAIDKNGKEQYTNQVTVVNKSTSSKQLKSLAQLQQEFNENIYIPQNVYKQPTLSSLINKVPSDKKFTAVPLEFQYMPVELLSKEFTKFNNPHKYRIHYLGPRPINSLILHKKYGCIQYEPLKKQQQQKHTFSRDHNKYQVNLRNIVQSTYMNAGLNTNHHYKKAVFYRAFEGMNPTLNLKDQIMFDSAFQSGNLDCVIKPKQNVFDLFVRIDSNTRGHTQWFYYSVRNGKKGQKLRMNICNITKGKTLYQQGMKPYIFSRKKKENNPQGYSWEQGGENVSFQEKRLRYDLIYENLSSPVFHELSFQYEFEYDDDEVYFSYSIPFTYSELIAKIHSYPKNQLRHSVLGKTFTGVDIPILHITNFESNSNFKKYKLVKQKKDQGKFQDRKKKNILITGRIHPGQSNSSHMLNGFIDYLLSDSKHAKELKDRINFFIVPMVNPDGVIMGNSRTSSAGKDLNREFRSSKYELYPEALLIKGLATRLKKNYNGVFMYLDFHGHSRKKNTFFYGPPYHLSQNEYYKCRAFPRLVEKINSSFRFYGCSFALNEEKRKTGRGVMFEQIKVPYTYTIQSSVGLFYNFENKLTVEFEEVGWRQMGRDICDGLGQFVVMEDAYEKLVQERAAARLKARQIKHQALVSNKNLGTSNEKAVSQAKPDSPIIDNQMADLQQIEKDPFEQLLGQVKQSCGKNNGNASKFQEQVSSDDHDVNEDMQESKLEEFNTLIVQSCHHDNASAKEKRRISKQFLEDQFGLDQEEMQLRPSMELIVPKLDLKKLGQTQLKGLKYKNLISSESHSARSTIHRRTIPPRSGQYRKSAFSSRKQAETSQDFSPKKTQSPKRPPKNFVLANKQRYSLPSRNLLPQVTGLPNNKFQPIELPKHIQHIRRQLTQGRAIINSLFQDKLKGVGVHETGITDKQHVVKDLNQSITEDQGNIISPVSRQRYANKKQENSQTNNNNNNDLINLKSYGYGYRSLDSKQIKNQSTPPPNNSNKLFGVAPVQRSSTSHITRKMVSDKTGKRPNNKIQYHHQQQQQSTSFKRPKSKKQVIGIDPFRGYPLMYIQVENMAMKIKTLNKK